MLNEVKHLYQNKETLQSQRTLHQSDIPKETMNKQDILTLYKYNQWTTARILNCVAQVTQEQFLAPAAFPHGGLRGTLVHALFAEWIWRNRWEGTSPTYRLKPKDFTTFESLRTRWMEEEEKLMAFVESLTDEKLNNRFSYKDTKGNPFERVLAGNGACCQPRHTTQDRSRGDADRSRSLTGGY
jgi:uncharacterized damage-inducible protein DinB